MEIIIIVESLIILCFIFIVRFLHEEIKGANKYIYEISEVNESLHKEIKHLTKVNKTYSEGLDFYINKNKDM